MKNHFDFKDIICLLILFNRPYIMSAYGLLKGDQPMGQVDFYLSYRPEIANPFTKDINYITVMASPLLQPYIRCFWGSTGSFNANISTFYDNTLVIPDTCFDVIFIQNHNTGLNRILFVGLSSSYDIDNWSQQDIDISIFAIRIHFWTMNIISKYPMTKTLNQILDPNEIFPNFKDFCIKIFSAGKFSEKIILAERYLGGLLDFGNVSTSFFNGVDFIIKKKGVGTLKQLSEHLCYSKRQTQRIYIDAVGITPKHLMDLVRYQSIWQEMLSSCNMDYMSTVYKYGYVDQSHFIADFKKYHSLTPKEALNKITCKNVSLISYNG